METKTCGYTVHDRDGEEQPCDRPATGWRWYQGHDHEDALDVACELHENEGGRRIHAVEAERDQWRAKFEQLAKRNLEMAERHSEALHRAIERAKAAERALAEADQ